MAKGKGQRRQGAKAEHPLTPQQRAELDAAIAEARQLTRLWDYYPLAPGAWQSIWALIEREPIREGKIKIREWRPMALWEAVGAFPLFRPARFTVEPRGPSRLYEAEIRDCYKHYTPGGVRLCYVPRADDLARVARLFPDDPDAGNNPPWDSVREELLAAKAVGKDVPAPESAAARDLLAILEAIRERGATRAPARRKRRPADSKALTARQTEIMHLVGECRGNLAEVARRVRLDRKTVAQHYKAASLKLGQKAVTAMTRKLPADRRGNSVIAGSLSPALPTDGRARVETDRRRG